MNKYPDTSPNSNLDISLIIDSEFFESYWQSKIQLWRQWYLLIIVITLSES